MPDLPEHHEVVHHSPVGIAETSTVMAAAGPLAGRWVLVVGAGTGFYPRLFRAAGASRVVGVDADRSLIAYAQRQEERDPLGISCEVHSPLKLPVIGDFDVVVAFGVAGPLDVVVAGLAANVRPGGLLVFAHLTPAALAGAVPGFAVTPDFEEAEGTRVTVRVEADPPVSFESFVRAPGTVEAALAAAGLRSIEQQPVTVPTDDESWRPLVANPPFAVLTARQP
ncbi:class I SAM-dependent methyltransferase [Amycolatopsis sp. NPDC049253]|uniref:class I SAM-dependent methyltransferase n=1 Tax=Amycolatopsis sp. NPDC049253 TaxID=3155274 RepID=UPI0034155D4E